MVITGVIRPPPDIRAVADKTALFVAKNGRAFEDRILKSEKGKTPKFAFLHSTSPFHAYYEHKIRFYEQGGTDGEEEEKKESSDEKKEAKDEGEDEQKEERKQDKAQKASAVDPVARSLLTQRNKITAAQNAMESDKEKAEGDESSPALELIPPPKLNFASIIAPNVAPVQLETIKLVAQFTALDGKGGSFMKDLAVREWSNPTFAFLQPRHGHFAYFSALVDGYRHILSTWTHQRDASAGLPKSVHECLDLAAYRAEYERDLAEKQQQQTEEGELSGAALIDWHDFVVVETIDFPSDEVVQTSLPPPPPPSTAAAAGDEMEESDEEGAGEAIRVVPTYQPKVVSTQSIATDTSRTHVIDPLTGKSIRIADMPEHMRIQLLDPKWAEERKKFLDKQKDSNLVAGDAIASNISRFAQARGDLFGKSASDMSGQDADSKQRLDEANRVIREQAQSQPGPMLPPQVPPPVAAPKAPMYSDQLLPPAKRARVEEGAPLGMPPPPPPAGLPPPPPPAAGELPPLAAQDVPMGEPPMLLSEADFAASLDSPTVTLSIQIPNDSSNSSWNFNGQVISLLVDVMSKVKAVKGELQSHLGGMPVNKIQLKGVQAGFLKDNQTLAQLNIGPTATLDMVPKTRGGRK